MNRSTLPPPTKVNSFGYADLQGNGYGHFGKTGKKTKWPYLYIPEWSSAFATSVFNDEGQIYAIYTIRLAAYIGLFQLPAITGYGSPSYATAVVVCVILAILFFSVITPLQHAKFLEQIRRPKMLARISVINSPQILQKKGLELEKFEQDYESFVAQAIYSLEKMLASSTTGESVRAGIEKLSKARE